jgi:hypothetical protein
MNSTVNHLKRSKNPEIKHGPSRRTGNATTRAPQKTRHKRRF